MLRKFVCVGFHSFPGEGAVSWDYRMSCLSTLVVFRNAGKQ
jgi:hypothetical protein